MGYPKSVSLIEFVMDFYTCDNILDTIWITDIKLLHFQFSKSGQILSVDKTGFFQTRSHLMLHNIIGSFISCLHPVIATAHVLLF